MLFECFVFFLKAGQFETVLFELSLNAREIFIALRGHLGLEISSYSFLSHEPFADQFHVLLFLDIFNGFFEQIDFFPEGVDLFIVGGRIGRHEYSGSCFEFGP